ncbi:PASTA domain-containing protein [Rubrobacter tropicus]
MNAVILKLLAKDPANRYADADELAEDLLRVRRGAPPVVAAVPGGAKTVKAPPPGRPAPTTRQPAAVRSRRRRTRGPLILGLLLLLLGLLGMGWALAQGQGTGGGAVEVPSVEGLARDEAVSRLQDAGFRAEIQTRQSGEEDSGVVVDQSPNGGGRAPEGSTVTLTVGAGARTVSVPEVRDLGFADAEAELTNAGLVVGETYDVPSDVAAGVVLEQGIAAGSEVEEGTAVNLGLSTGPAPTTPSPSDASASQQPDGGASADPASASASARPNADAGEAQKDAQKEAREAAREAQKEAREAAKDRAEEIRKEAEE